MGKRMLPVIRSESAFAVPDPITKTVSPAGDSTRQVCTWSPAPLERRDLVVEVGERPDELEGEELLLEARRAPYLEELVGSDGDAGPAGAKGHGFHGVLEGDLVEDHLPVQIHEKAPLVSIDDQEEQAVRRSGGRRQRFFDSTSEEEEQGKKKGARLEDQRRYLLLGVDQRRDEPCFESLPHSLIGTQSRSPPTPRLNPFPFSITFRR
ncbi:hypothetical protein FH972_001361 [Carpinus fangiana]|uniref:Uncharacterized protein n=1 Tax=Carpinus fangiana TaxID=176857 RepID=A0A5N6QBN6_9ROSI|nr:hypothetical protein FH972_001361 [Carpinus fangiana]